MLRPTPQLVTTCCFLALLFTAPSLRAQAPRAGAPPEEVRGLWVTRWDYKTQQDVQRAVRWAAVLRMNRVFFQVRGRADAFYRSRLEPWAEELGGRDPGFDPLATALEEARKVGIELHAWVNLFPAWKGATAPANPDHIYHRQPEWFLLDSRGKRLLLNSADYTILNPCLPEVREYLATVLADIVQRYPVDGVQLDYVRFISSNPRVAGDVPFDPRSLSLFRSYSGSAPALAPDLWARWKTLSVNTALYQVSETIRKVRPGCVVSVAAIGNYERARTGLHQDVVKWQERGWVDEVYPMVYYPDASTFRQSLSAILAQTPRGAPVYPGIGVFLHKRVEESHAQIYWTRSLGTGGYALYAFTNFFPSPSHEYSRRPEAQDLRGDLRTLVYQLNAPVEPATPPTVTEPQVRRLANVPTRR